MRKFMIMVAIFGSLGFVSEANADSRRHGYRSVDRHHHRHYVPAHRPHHHYNNHRRHNWVPYAAGALALGALGTGAYYYNYNRPHCWIETQDLFDRRGRYLGTQDVKVCR